MKCLAFTGVCLCVAAPAAGLGGHRESQAGHTTRDELHYQGRLVLHKGWMLRVGGCVWVWVYAQNVMLISTV